MQETRVWSLGWEDLLEKGMAIHSSILAWRIPWTEKPGRWQSMGLQRVGHNWSDLAHTSDFIVTRSFYLHLPWECYCCFNQLCLTLCDPMDCSPPGSSVHGISQARILEWLPFPPPGDLPDPGIKPASPALAGGFFAIEPPGKPMYNLL